MAAPAKTTRASGQQAPAGYEIYLMCHGAAVSSGEAGYGDDSKRPLTPQGKKKMQEIARGLRRLGVAPDWIVTSPLVRAVESAKIVAESLAARTPVEFLDALSPGGSAESLVAFLAKHPNRTRTLLVGQEPGLSELAARLIGASGRPKLALKKGGCCEITLEEFPPQSPGQLEWWLTPRVLRKIV